MVVCIYACMKVKEERKGGRVGRVSRSKLSFFALCVCVCICVLFSFYPFSVVSHCSSFGVWLQQTTTTQQQQKGEWKEGQWHGQGRATFANGDTYDGMYSLDQRQGKGTYHWNDGRVYLGEFVADGREGLGLVGIKSSVCVCVCVCGGEERWNEKPEEKKRGKRIKWTRRSVDNGSRDAHSLVSICVYVLVCFRLSADCGVNGYLRFSSIDPPFIILPVPTGIVMVFSIHGPMVPNMKVNSKVDNIMDKEPIR
jgi:hypothetical protein